MSNDITEQVRAILYSFIGDPPDTDFQSGYLAAVLVIANEVVGIKCSDPLYREADALLKGYPASKQETTKRHSLKVVSRSMPSPDHVK